MNRKPLSRSHFPRAVSMVVVSLLLVVLAGTLSARDRSIIAWETYMRIVSSYGELQALQDYLSGITGPGNEGARDALLANPLDALERAEVPFDADGWQITVINIAKGREVGAIGVSPALDAERPARPQCIGVSLDGVAMTVQLAGAADVVVLAVDGALDLLLNIPDALVDELIPTLRLLDGKSTDNVDRTRWLSDAQPWYREELGVDFSRAVYRLTAFDYDIADDYAAQHGEDPIYTVRGGTGDTTVSEEVIGFVYEDIGVILAQVQ